MRIVRIGFAIAVLALGISAANAGPACEAAGFVAGAGNAIDSAARSRSPAAFAAAAARFTDLRTISLFALGKYRNQLSKAREAEYLALTRAFIGRFMARHASSVRASSLQITGCSAQASGLIVNAKLPSGGTVIFKLGKSGSGYRIVDINLRSIWLAQQLRTNFAGVIKRGGGDIGALFKYLNA